MPLTQEKRLDNKFSNNNDHSYLHKKFKKMASTMSMLPGSSIKGEESGYQETSLSQVTCSSTITNGSIAAAHPEIEKIKVIYDKRSMDVEKNVQTNFNDENIRLSDVNSFVQIPGKTSFSEEFLHKTENLENDFIKETYSGGTGRYICPYCKISCAKPSVLQKHIRAHTNERPFPCIPCGFAFKTKSNLYKHRRSRTHALRLQGADIASTINDDDLSGDSESDTSIPPTSLSGSDRDQSSDTSMIRSEKRPSEFSSPELINDSNSMSVHMLSSLNDNKSKTIYKPKFRAAFYHGMDEKDKIKKTISQNADFLTEHISKIISDNEAIVDVIETPLQKKYGKIKQIAESKQFLNENEITPELTPLNLTKNCYETENLIRKRSHSDSFAQIFEDQKHPLNPEGSIIKDLLLKTKANGLNSVTSELVDGLGPLYVCPLCQIVYRSADNLEVHRLYYCKGAPSNNSTAVNTAQKEIKSTRPENIYFRSNSINVRLPENTMSPVCRNNISPKSPPSKSKPDNLEILKPDCNDIIAPLPSPGPLLGNTRLVDSRLPSEFNKKTETLKVRPKQSSPKRRLDSRSESYSPRLLDNSSPRSGDLFSQPKIRCMEINTSSLRSMEDMSPHIRHNSTSLQMFGGEVKIVDHSGSTTTLRIEPSKTQLSPILIHQNLSPSKFANDLEASSVVVRSGLHSGGTIVHNPPTPKETVSTPQIQTSRISVSTPTAQNSNLLNVHDITHFQFPPLSAITAYNPLTLPPLSPSSSPNGAITIFHGGKFIPHVPGIPGPNTPGLLVGNNNMQFKNNECLKNVAKFENISDSSSIINMHARKGPSANYDRIFNSKSPNTKSNNEMERQSQNKDSYNADLQSTVPIIKIKHVDEPIPTSFPNNNVRVALRTEGAVKRNAEGFPKTPVLKENSNYLFIKSKVKDSIFQPHRNADGKTENEIKNFNFENLITKVEIYNNQIPSSADVQKNCNVQETCATSLQNERSETSYFQKNLATKSLTDDRKPKFLRPSTLPLKPGTFTPKKHHGITPNANTMPLISPETPRPAKAYGQLYLNGNAYTYLGLKCSTKVFYCTINRPQPTYVPNQHFLSMYSNWQLLSELTPDPLGLSASSAMSLYDSRHRPQNVAVAVIKQDLILTHSSQWNKNSKDNKQIIPFMDTGRSDDLRNITDNIATSKKEVTGGFESNEEYTYVRGRGRGRYVCSECGIRCKKPSMLKKHIRTHTDVRPYTCVHCVFSFKTKGNLTKHMKSKAHYKKCCELGINPNDGNDGEGTEMAQCSGETDDETDSDGDEGNEGETESSDTEICKSRLPEHEAAHCLLSLGGSRPATSATPGLITSARPTTYPYTPVSLDNETNNTPEQLQILDPKMDVDNEPMDLSKNEVRAPNNVPEIPTARESSVLASLASNTAKLPQHQSQWGNGEPMLHTYLTERALLDSKIKQSQLTCNPKTKKIDLENSMFPNIDGYEKGHKKTLNTFSVKMNTSELINRFPVKKNDTNNEGISQNSTMPLYSETMAKSPSYPHSENTNIEHSKQTRIKPLKAFDNSLESHPDIKTSDESNGSKTHTEEKARTDGQSDLIEIKPPLSEYDSGQCNVGTEKTDVDGTSYSPKKLMEDDQRVCFFCKETFTKPPRPFRCSICAVSFRTRGHLLVHERSASHNIKISMTPNSENAKHVVSEYLKHARINPTKSLDDPSHNQLDISSEDREGSKIPMEEKIRIENNMDGEGVKLPLTESEPMASKEVNEGKDFEIEDDWRDCDFCNKMFREPAQLKLHLNIHYMERPFRCSVCAVSNRTKEFLLKHDRLSYQSNKVTKKPNSENAKYVVSEYLKHARINPIKNMDDPLQNQTEISSDDSNAGKVPLEEKTRLDESSEGDGIKLAPTEYDGNQFDSVAPKVVIGVGGVAFKVTKGKDFEGTSYSPGKLMEDGRRVCDFCNKTFTKPSQLRLHLNIHYMERPFRCSVCAVSFRTRGHLQKHERSASHHNKVSMTSTFGAASSFNPRPFRCSDCNIAFRIHGHLAKHLRSKMHVMRLECLFKLPFGTFTEIERAGLSLTDIDTTDCASSLASLQSLARKLHEKDPTKLEYREPSGALPSLPPVGRDSSEDEDSGVITEKTCDSVNDSEIKTIENNKGHDTELRVNYSATDN